MVYNIKTKLGGEQHSKEKKFENSTTLFDWFSKTIHIKLHAHQQVDKKRARDDWY